MCLYLLTTEWVSIRFGYNDHQHFCVKRNQRFETSFFDTMSNRQRFMLVPGEMEVEVSGPGEGVASTSKHSSDKAKANNFQRDIRDSYMGVKQHWGDGVPNYRPEEDWLAPLNWFRMMERALELHAMDSSFTVLSRFSIKFNEVAMEHTPVPYKPE